jgi:hypothetical protein
MKLSARNQLSGTVTSVNEGAAIANVELDVNGQGLVASITVEAARARPSGRHAGDGDHQGVRRHPRHRVTAAQSCATTSNSTSCASAR